MTALGWTEADGAELAVLVHELSVGFFAHRECCAACSPEPCPTLTEWQRHLAECAGCRGDAPLGYPACPGRRADFVAHGDTCAKCNPCPSLVLAVELVAEWQAARELQSRAEWLRANPDKGARPEPAAPARPRRVLRLGDAGRGVLRP